MSIIKKEYFETIKGRKEKSRVYKKFQLTGLMIAELLRDEAHKSLYIKLAKDYDENLLMSLAKDVSERSGVAKKGAYFMRILQKEKKWLRKKSKKSASS